MKALVCNLWSLSVVLILTINSCVDRSYVQVSESEPSYFSIGEEEEPFIPIGTNLSAVGSVAEMDTYLRQIHENGGNFARVWLNTALYEFQNVYGKIDTLKLSNIDSLLASAEKYEIKVKLCIESFRYIVPGKNKWDTMASLHTSNGGPFADMKEYITEGYGKREFVNRVRILDERYGGNPNIFGWELWNEMNAVDATEMDVFEWTKKLLPEVKSIFPEYLVMQSLGSLDRNESFNIYELVNSLDNNEVNQVHRYLDEGAPLQVCHDAVDVLCSDAVRHMKDIDDSKPILLAESGAVKPCHTGPSTLYQKDSLGTIMHDVLFAPFFSGAAGPGHMWHWDHYIAKQNVWFQIKRFANAVHGVNPVKEKFETFRDDVGELRIYTLNGRNMTLSWCRDTVSTWASELRDANPARDICGTIVDFSERQDGRRIRKVSFYDPWKDIWTDLDTEMPVKIPDFKRSGVIKIEYF